MKKNLIVFIIILLISGIVSCIIGSDETWDLYSYHYYNAYAILHNKINIDIMPAGIQSYLNPVLDIIYYIIINLFRDYKYIVMFLLGFPYGCLTFVLYLINEKIFNRISENNIIRQFLVIIATFIGASECFIVSEIGVSCHDIDIGVFVLLALLFTLNYLETEKNKYIIGAGFLLGIACGLKYTSIIYIFALLITFFIFNIKADFKKFLYNFMLLCLFIFIGFILVNGYWMYILWHKFHNPVFPMLNEIFKSEWFTYVNYKDWDFSNINTLGIKSLYFPLIWDNNPFTRVAELQFFDFRHSLAYISILLSLILFFNQLKSKFINSIENNFYNKKYFFILIFVIVSYLLWLKMFGILRYLIPILSLSGIFIVYVLSVFIKNKKVLFTILSFLLIFIFYKYETPAWGRCNEIIKVPELIIKENSVVLLYGKPIGYYAAREYPNVRFIYLYDDNDGRISGFRPSEKYYEYLDEIIRDKHKYIIITEQEINRDKPFNNYIKEKYINKEKRCKIKPFFYDTTVQFCEYLD